MSFVDLIKLVKRGDTKAIEKLLSEHQIELNQVKQITTVIVRGGLFEVTPLMLACMHGHLDVAELLIQKGAQVDYKTRDGWSALTKAFKDGKPETVRLLIKHGAQANPETFKKLSWIAEPFMSTIVREPSFLKLSCLRGDVEMVRALLAKGAHIDPSEFPDYPSLLDNRISISYRASPVNIAVKGGHVELVKWMLEQGVKIPFGALFLAISQNNIDMAQILVKHMSIAQLNATEEGVFASLQCSALMFACSMGESSFVELLLNSGVDVNLQERQKAFALYLAAEKGFSKITKLLLERGALVNMEGPAQYTALKSIVMRYPHVAEHDFIDTVKVLIEGGAEYPCQEHISVLDEVQIAPRETVKLLLKGYEVIQNTQLCVNLARSPEEIEILRLFLEIGLCRMRMGSLY